MQHDVIEVPGPQELAARAAEMVAEIARTAIDDHQRFRLAVSGGSTPWAMFSELVHHDVDWSHTEIFQVDERLAPDGDPDRNLTHLQASLAGAPADIHAMQVAGESSLAGAAAAYGEELPERFDLVHLGLGPDGHTASLVPGDPVLEVSDRLVAVTEPYQGHRRMTLTYPALARADRLLWLISGASKQTALGKLLAGERSIPAGRVSARASTIVCDHAALHGDGE